MNCCCWGRGGDSFLEKALVSPIAAGKESLRPSRVILYILEKKYYFDVKDEVCLERKATRNSNPSFPLLAAGGRDVRRGATQAPIDQSPAL